MEMYQPDTETNMYQRAVQRFISAWEDGLGFVIVSIGIFFLFIGVLVCLVNYADRATCRAKAAAMGVPSSWGPMQDCIITVDGKRVPLDSYRVVHVEATR